MRIPIDLNEDFFIKPYFNGLQIVKPGLDHNEIGRNSIKEVLKFPINIYFQLPGGKPILRCNEQVLITHQAPSFGYYSIRDFEGISAEKIGKRAYIDRIEKNDAQLLKAKQLMVYEENIMVLKDNQVLEAISFKFPCYYDINQSPIVFGMTILLDNTLYSTAASLQEGMLILLKSGLLTQYSSMNYLVENRSIDGVYITTQQAKCLKLAAKGLTAKKIGSILSISYRTVERHFENLKYKLNVKSKLELIEKFMDFRLIEKP
jgi:DNA-binding CsgD family transcriptional regulator